MGVQLAGRPGKFRQSSKNAWNDTYLARNSKKFAHRGKQWSSKSDEISERIEASLPKHLYAREYRSIAKIFIYIILLWIAKKF